MIGDISYITDKDYVDVKVQEEEDIRLAQDIIDDGKVSALKTTFDGLSLTATNTNITTSTDTINSQLGKSISSAEYTNTPLYLEYFPNVPSNNIKSVYYTDFMNLTNSVALKVKTLIDSMITISGDLNTNPAYIKLVDLKDAKIPILASKVDSLINIGGSQDTNNDTFLELVNQVKKIQQGSVGQSMLDQQAEVDNLMEKLQTTSTKTRYYDNVSKKYYMLYVDNRKIYLKESYSPSTVLYDIASTAKTCFPSYNSGPTADDKSTPTKLAAYYTALESTLNLYNADFHTTINNTVYVIKGDYLYLYLKDTKKLKAKIRYQLARFNQNNLSAEFKDEYAMFKATYDDTLPTAIGNTNNYHMNNKATNYSIFTSYFKFDLLVGPQTYDQYWKNKESIYLFESDDGKLLFMGGSQNKHVCVINLEKLNDTIIANGTNKVYINHSFFANSNNYVKINLYEDPAVYAKIQALPNVVIPKVKVSSMHYNVDIQTLFVAYANNLVVLYEINMDKMVIPTDSGQIVSYQSNYSLSESFRLGATESEQNSIKLRAISYDSLTSKIICAVYINLTTTTTEDSICQVSIRDEYKTLYTIFKATSGSFIMSNNVCSLQINKIQEGSTLYNEYIVSSKYSGSRFSQYYWKNTKYDYDKFIHYDNYSNRSFGNVESTRELISLQYYDDRNYEDTQYLESNLNENEVIFESSKFLLILNKYKSKVSPYISHLMYNYSLKLYDKINNVVVYDTTDYSFSDVESQNILTQTKIDNLSAIVDKRNTTIDNGTTGSVNHNDLLFIGIDYINLATSEFTLLFESAFNAINRASMFSTGPSTKTLITDYRLNSTADVYFSNVNHLPQITSYFPDLINNRNLYNITCKLLPL